MIGVRLGVVLFILRSTRTLQMLKLWRGTQLGFTGHVRQESRGQGIQILEGLTLAESDKKVNGENKTNK